MCIDADKVSGKRQRDYEIRNENFKQFPSVEQLSGLFNCRVIRFLRLMFELLINGTFSIIR